MIVPAADIPPEFDPALNTEYMPSQRVPDAAAYFAAWTADSAAVRQVWPPLELAYGRGPHERLDIFEPVSTARGTVLFIHGGYWLAFYKSDFSYLAPPLLEAGWRVAVMSYDLAPVAPLRQIVRQARQAAAFVSQHYGPLVVAGHSAGAHLAAMIHCTEWQAENLPVPALLGSIGISGLYDLLPLRHTELQPDLKLSVAEARNLSPVAHLPGIPAPFLVALGELESAEFYAQSAALLRAWPGVAYGFQEGGPRALSGRHHFDAPEQLPELLAHLTSTVFLAACSPENGSGR